jgi:hypothetical protein
MKFFISVIVTTVLLISAPVFSQEKDEPLFEEFKNAFSKPYLRIGLVLQTTGNFQIEREAGTNGFELTNLRLKLSGKFDKGIGYAIQTSFTRSPSILDARIYYEIDKSFIVDAGLYKAPFSREFLISTPYTDFVSRAQLTALVPNRQIGVTARGLIPGTQLTYSAGVFNGNRFSTAGNDNNDMMYVGRLSFNPAISQNKSDKLEIAVNVAQSNDKNVNISPINNAFEGKRFLLGGDTRLEYDKWMISGEVVYAKLEPADAEEFEPFSYQATIGYMIINKVQLLLRWDSFKMNDTMDANELAILGLNIWPSQISQFRINYIVPTKSMPKHHTLLVGAQVAF